MADSSQDRRTLLAIGLSLAVVMVWQVLSPPPPPVEPAPASAPAAGPGAAPAVGPVAAAVPAAAAPSAPVAALPLADAPFTGAGFHGVVRSVSGTPTALIADGYQSRVVSTPFWTWLLDGAEGDWVPFSGGEAPRPVLSDAGALVLAGAGPLDDDGGASPTVGSYALSTGAGGLPVAQRVRPDGLVITKSYAAGPHDGTLAVTVRLENKGTTSFPTTWVGVADTLGGEAGQFLDHPRPVAYVDDGVEHVMELDDVAGAEVVTWEDPPSWFGLGDRYFLAALLPEAGSSFGSVVVDDLPSGRVGTFAVGGPLAPGEVRELRFVSYTGPMLLDRLEAISPSFAEAVEYGWFGFFARMLLFTLKIFYAGVGNWGAAIVLLTLLVKVIFFPLTQRAFMSGQKMQTIQPRLAELREKYADNQQMQAQETMKLFSEAGVSPMGGCLPTLVQFPVWIALYNVMLYSTELYGARFLYLRDLTTADPYGVIPVVYTLLMVWQQSFMPTASLDPAQQKMLKLMPFIFAAFMFSFPSGLVVYFCVNMLLTIAQQWLIKRKYGVAPHLPA